MKHQPYIVVDKTVGEGRLSELVGVGTVLPAWVAFHKRRETGEQDLFRSRLDQIIDLKHPLVTLGRTVC